MQVTEEIDKEIVTTKLPFVFSAKNERI